MNKSNIVLSTVIGLCAATAAWADQSAAIIERCKQTTADSDRIACLEAAIMMQATGAAPEPPSTVLDAGAAEVFLEDAPVETDTAAAENDDSEALNGNMKETGQPIATGIGAQQVIARQQTQEEMLASLERATNLKVSKYETVPYEKLQVTLENGQIWRQIKGDTQKINVSLRKNQTVDISESSISGYKLRLNEIRRTIRVQRIR